MHAIRKLNLNVSVDELLSLMLQDSTVELDPALDEMLSILSSLDKGVDKPKD